ncbi:PRC-barrel domain-containing protein [Salinimicrobium terrae]|uniref:PRC-barrel domain-containing protein n=1 Tax=Salinimicrobium terrae TaxID=470866 RepID=UPI00146D20C7|nr:PRC-barrel domain-containing protein [Salinimicrobium terrae]
MEENRKTGHLEELEHKHWYDISSDEPNVMHWNIIDDAGKKIGVVKDLLFDREAKRARYLITNLKDGMLEKHIRVLVPVGRARLNKADKRIILPAVSLQQLNRLPEYKGVESLTSRDEQTIRDVFSENEPDKNAQVHDREQFYEHDDFKEEQYLGKS